MTHTTGTLDFERIAATASESVTAAAPAVGLREVRKVYGHGDGALVREATSVSGSRTRIVGALWLGACVALVGATAPAASARKPIKARLSQPGYTVIALGDEGRAKSARVRHGGFTVRPPAARVTLHLRAPNGKYAGPIVVGGSGSRVIVGVRAGARLGRVRVRAGYARVTRRLPRQWLDTTRTARARRGVPLGAGNYGYVRSRPSRASAARRRDDPDLDGVPNALDIDDDGNLVLDNFERSRRGRRARAAQGDLPVGPGAPLYLDSGLEQIPLETTVNANATALTVDEINATLSTYGRISLDVANGQNSAELDCGGQPDPNNPNGWIGGLTYCTRGGTGVQTWPEPFSDKPQPFPGPPGGQLDPDGNGYGTVIPEFQLHHHAVTRDPSLDPTTPEPGTIGTGDVLIERIAGGGGVSEFTGTLQTVLATTPALVFYSDTAGHSATVSYPVPPPGSDCSRPGCPGGLGTEGNGFPVAGGPCPAGAPPACVNGDIVVTLTFWRPERRPIPPETAPWMDIGGLTYADAFGCEVNGVSQQCGNTYCPPSAYSVPANSELTPTTLPDAQGGLADSAPDRPADARNTFTYSVDLSECLRDPRGFGALNGLSWDPGKESQFVFQGTNLLDNSEQVVFLSRVG